VASRGTEQELLEAARGGDQEAFRRLVEPHRPPLYAHCNRMLGSSHEAEDALQDALLRAWRGLGGFGGRSALRTWLHRITTNACLDTIARRPKRVLPIDDGAPADGGTHEPYAGEAPGIEDSYAAPEARYEQREAVELAFVAALEHLPPRQRAVLILRDVLSLSAKEVSESLGTTVAAINSALQRAHKAVDDRLPEKRQQSTLRSLDDGRVRETVRRFIDAFELGDIDALVGLLAEDAASGNPSRKRWSRGRDAIADSWLVARRPPPRCLLARLEVHS
jgi:RNA polymerase sigma-70 factor, ECF subfamily